MIYRSVCANCGLSYFRKRFSNTFSVSHHKQPASNVAFPSVSSSSFTFFSKRFCASPIQPFSLTPQMNSFRYLSGWKLPFEVKFTKFILAERHLKYTLLHHVCTGTITTVTRERITEQDAKLWTQLVILQTRVTWRHVDRVFEITHVAINIQQSIKLHQTKS